MDYANRRTKKETQKPNEMIYEQLMFSCKCDLCGETWKDASYGYIAFTDKSSIIEYIKDDGWVSIGDNWYCYGCHEIDENNNIVLDIAKARRLKIKELKNEKSNSI